MFPSVRFRYTLPPHLPVVLKSVFFAASVICCLAQGCFCAASTDALHRLTSEAGSKSLRIYFVDVEGGQATLFVTPNGQSLLIDTGWPGNKGRDADRILTVAKDAGIRKVDYVLVTHFHVDHVGGAPQLTAKIPVGTFIDHGDNREAGAAATAKGWAAYRELVSNEHHPRISVKPGDRLPLNGITATVVSSDGALLHSEGKSSAQENSACRNAEHFKPDQTENSRSVGTLITFGKLKILDLGDLTHDKEFELMCPTNQLGKVDLYIVSHHGSSESGSPVLLNSIAPRLAIMDNGATKGGSASVWDTIKQSPRLEDLWQLHFSNAGGADHNVPAQFIANPQGPDAGNFFKVTAWEDGAMEVFNSRTQKTKRYPPK